MSCVDFQTFVLFSIFGNAYSFLSKFTHLFLVFNSDSTDPNLNQTQSPKATRKPPNAQPHQSQGLLLGPFQPPSALGWSRRDVEDVAVRRDPPRATAERESASGGDGYNARCQG